MSTSEKIPVTVVVTRVEFPGFYCLGGTEFTDADGKLHKTLRGKKGVFFPNGATDIEVTPDELAALKAEAAKTVEITVESADGKTATKQNRKALPISVIEYSPAEMALRRAAAAEKEFAEAEAAAEKAMAEAQARQEVAKRLRETADQVQAVAGEKGKTAGGRR